MIMLTFAPFSFILIPFMLQHRHHDKPLRCLYQNIIFLSIFNLSSPTSPAPFSTTDGAKVSFYRHTTSAASIKHKKLANIRFSVKLSQPLQSEGKRGDLLAPPCEAQLRQPPQTRQQNALEKRHEYRSSHHPHCHSLPGLYRMFCLRTGVSGRVYLYGI